jgi:membrane-bound ClpP family serine protease
MDLWTTDADGSVVIPTRREPAYVLVGVVLLFIGGGILLQLVRAIAASRAAVDAAWTEYVPVVGIFGGLGLAFVIVGHLIALSKRVVRLDVGRREIRESTTRLFRERTTTHALSAFTSIVIVRRVFQARRKMATGGSAPGKQYPYFAVELSGPSGALKLAKEQHETPARELAERLSATTGLPLDDQLARQKERDAREDEADDT